MKLGVDEAHPFELGAEEICALELDVSEICALELGADQDRPLELGVDEVRLLELSVPEVGRTEVCAAQVKRWVCLVDGPPPKHRHDGLHIWRAYDQVGDNGGTGGLRGSRGALSNVGSENLENLKAGGGGLVSYSFQAIDATESLLKFGAAELVDSASKPFGYLASPGKLQLLGELVSVSPGLISVGLELLPGDEDRGQRGYADQPLH